jgi:hypothetical protein
VFQALFVGKIWQPPTIGAASRRIEGGCIAAGACGGALENEHAANVVQATVAATNFDMRYAPHPKKVRAHSRVDAAKPL